jgi:hypothetical protein
LLFDRCEQLDPQPAAFGAEPDGGADGAHPVTALLVGAYVNDCAAIAGAPPRISPPSPAAWHDSSLQPHSTAWRTAKRPTDTAPRSPATSTGG